MTNEQKDAAKAAAEAAKLAEGKEMTIEDYKKLVEDKDQQIADQNKVVEELKSENESAVAGAVIVTVDSVKYKILSDKIIVPPLAGGESSDPISAKDLAQDLEACKSLIKAKSGILVKV